MAKGDAGKNTGSKARKAINDARKRGNTLDQIAKAARRSVETLNQIADGDIKNPPADVARRINQLPDRKKKDKKK